MKRRQKENPNETEESCPKCSSRLYRRSIRVVRGSCWSCHAPMPIAFGSDGLTMMGPPEFVPLELEAAAKGGAVLREHFSKTTQTKYLANTCQSCGTFCGDFYLHDFWDEEPIVPPIELVLGCVECFTAVATTPGPDGEVWTGVIPHAEGDLADAPSPVRASKSPTPRPKSKAKPERRANPKLPIVTAVPLWGRCGDCGVSACPATVSDEKFFCSQCRGVRRFIPDLL